MTTIGSVFAGAMIYMRKSAGAYKKYVGYLSAFSSLGCIWLDFQKILGCNLVFSSDWLVGVVNRNDHASFDAIHRNKCLE
jgi:hypothetical protein